jgi:putative membrane protein
MHQPNRLPLLFADASAEGSMFTRLVEPVVQSAVFALVGVVVFALAFWVMAKVAPFSIRKEIEHDQNTALGIIVGSIVIGLAMIIASAIKG